MTGDREANDYTRRVRTLLVDQYRIEREIGRGGMAIVFEALDEQHGRTVAVKVLRPELAVALGPQRFLREIEIAAKLHHPHIIPLLSSGQIEDILYFTMPFVEGESLHDRLVRESQLPIEDAVRIATELGGALAYAHDQGVVHRDVKPGNILFSSGHATVADFGIASAITIAGGEQLTSTGLALGTPAYASPEQASGKADVDGRSDVYSLGCVLYEMLAGEPPFSGRTAQVILARHMIDAPASVATARPSVPPHVDAVLQRALAKTPADRFGSAADFVKALHESDTTQVFFKPPKAPPTRTRGTALKVVGTVAALAALASIPFILRARAEPLDPNKVVYFALTEERLGPDDSGAGYEVALAIEGALAYADPLEMLDGRLWMERSADGGEQSPRADVAEAISREQGARYFLSGAVRGDRDSDSVTVTLRLHDVTTRAPPRQAVRRGPMNRVALVGVDAVKELLPELVDPGRQIDLTPIEDRDAAAVALWVQGEREYRNSRFVEARGLYERAIELDSALALAAIQGAQAAEWGPHTGDDVMRLVGVALEHDSLLPPRYSFFAHGLDAYYRGQADSALAQLTQALAEAPTWSEARYMTGEVQYHLIPSGMATDSVAEQSFLAAIEADSTFTPPLFHLSEIALRRGDADRAAELIEQYRRLDSDPLLIRMRELMLDCLRKGPESVEWPTETRDDVTVTRRAASAFVGGATQPACAEAGTRAFIGVAGARGRGTAVTQLQGLLVAQGRYTEAIALVDSAREGTDGDSPKDYILDALAGAPTGVKADEFVEFTWERWGLDSLTAGTHWLLGVWQIERGDLEAARENHRYLADSARIEGGRRYRLLTESLAGHLALAEGDTARALAVFRSLKPTAPRRILWWRRAEPLPLDRLRLAELLLTTGEYEEALVTASGFDHHAPAVYVAFIPRSLVLRIEAARALGRDDLVARYRERLEKLGRDDLLEAIDAS